MAKRSEVLAAVRALGLDPSLVSSVSYDSGTWTYCDAEHNPPQEFYPDVEGAGEYLDFWGEDSTAVHITTDTVWRTTADWIEND